MAPSRFRRSVLFAAIALLAGTSCRESGATIRAPCTAVGCVNGLTVHLASLPAGNFKVEVFSGPASSGAPAYTYECTGSPACIQNVFLHDFMPHAATIRVTTSAGVKITELPSITYIKSRPNGPDCEPECWQATVDAALPATLEL